MRDKVRGAIVGVAIGDALGMPVEALSPKTISKYFKWVNSYRTPNPKTKTWHKLKRGQWTDDTQLTLAIGESIVRQKDINFDDIAKAHVEAFRNDRRGWGRATINGCQKILSGADWWNAGSPNAAGNGPPMKIAPIGVLYGLGKIAKLDMINACINISKMTHGDTRAVIGAILQAYLVGVSLKNESHYGVMRCITLELPSLCFELEEIVSVNAYQQSLYYNIRDISTYCILDDHEIRGRFGARAFVNESLPFTYAMIAKYGNDLKNCMERIINQGGDADTTGAMAGSVLGALHGYSNFPDRWRWRLEERARLVKLADDLYQMSK